MASTFENKTKKKGKTINRKILIFLKIDFHLHDLTFVLSLDTNYEIQSSVR